MNTDLQYDVIARTAQETFWQDESDFRHQTLCHQWRTGHPHHTFMKDARSRAYGAIIPKAFVTEKTNYTQPRNASAVELVWKYVPTGHWHWLPRVLSPTNKMRVMRTLCRRMSGNGYRDIRNGIYRRIPDAWNRKEIPFMDQSGGGVTFVVENRCFIPNSWLIYWNVADNREFIGR